MLRKSLVLASLLMTVSSMAPAAASGEDQTSVQAQAMPHDQMYLIVQDKIRIKTEMQHLVSATELKIALMEESLKNYSGDSTEFGYDKKILALLREKVPAVKNEIGVMTTLQ